MAEGKSPFISWPRPDPNAQTPPLDIVAFLRGRLDERKLMLLNVGPARVAWATFRHADGSMKYTSVVSANGDVWVCDGHIVEPDSVQVVFDRDHELADVAAKRQILRLHEPCLDEPECHVCGLHGTSGACLTLCLLALPYAGHPDYHEEWKP